MRDTATMFTYGKVVAGEVNYIVRVPVSAGTYSEGDLIETTDGATFAKATADPKYANSYFVCAEDNTLTDAGEVVCYKEGYFNKNILKINGAVASDAAIEVLKTKNIFVTEVASQDFGYTE